MTTQRLTMAQALVRHLAALRVEMNDGTIQPYCAGVFAIFGHGNVAGLGEALWASAPHCPPTARTTSRHGPCGHRLRKAQFRQRIMAVSTSIGPGATNLLTAAALAHVNRLPVLLLPGDTLRIRARPTRCCSSWRTSARAMSVPTMLPPGDPLLSTASAAPSRSWTPCRARSR
jgi:3D-(3,5/4)-trihydroxycyclohexane-1,2-dione acylhydrolase (decyclizing)